MVGACTRCEISAALSRCETRESGRIVVRIWRIMVPISLSLLYRARLHACMDALLH